MYQNFPLELSVINPKNHSYKNSEYTESERIKVIVNELYFQILLLNDAFQSLCKDNNYENNSVFGVVIHDSLFCLLKLRSALPNNCDIKALYSLLLCLHKQIIQLKEKDERMVKTILSKV